MEIRGHNTYLVALPSTVGSRLPEFQLSIVSPNFGPRISRTGSASRSNAQNVMGPDPDSSATAVMTARSPPGARRVHCCRYERILCVPIAGDIVVERRRQIPLQLRIGASSLRVAAQIVAKQETVPPSGMIFLQNMEVVCPSPNEHLPEEQLSGQP